MLMYFYVCMTYIATHFPSIGSDDPLGVENVKIQGNSEKIRGPPGGTSTTLFRPLKIFGGPYRPLKEGSRTTHIHIFRPPSLPSCGARPPNLPSRGVP